MSTTAGYVNEKGERIYYTSALSEEAGKAFTLLCVGQDLFSRDEQGRVRVGPDGRTPIPGTEHAARFMVAFMQVYGRPWGNDAFTRGTWIKDYKRGVEELEALGVVVDPKFNALGEPVTDAAGFPVVGVFHRHRIDLGVIDMKEGPLS